ncbi:MAG: hypothetical protein R3E58_05580 [Phycisphaerae bacterium]
MSAKFQNSDVLLAGLAFLLALCTGCQFQGGNEPDPQPEPFPNPDPINTNGPDPFDPDPVDPDPVTPDPINSNGEDPVDPDPIEVPVEPTARELLVGAWAFDSGYPFDGYNQDFEVEYVEFYEDGSAMFFRYNAATRTNECRTAVYAPGGINDVTIGVESGSPKAYKFEIDDADTLYITNGDLETSVFTRVEAIPFEATCPDLLVHDRFELDFKLDGPAELGFDGQNLWVTRRESGYLQYPIDVSTGVVGEPVDFGYARLLAFVQDNDIWTTCGCGGDRTLSRFSSNPPAKVDEFDVSTLGFDINIEAATIDADGEYILLHGSENTLANAQFVSVAVDTKVATGMGAFKVHLKSMTLYSGYVFAIHGDYLLVIDLEQLETIATFRLPDPEVTWKGIERAGDDLWIAGNYREVDRSVLLKISTPQAFALPGQLGGVFSPVLNP